MTQRRSGAGRRTGRRGARRKVEWFDFEINVTAVASQLVPVNLTANLQDDEKKGMTLLRTILHLELLTPTVGTGGKLAMGLLMVEDDALAAAALPEPEDNIQKPAWTWKAIRSFHTSVANDRAQITQIDADLRGRRRFPASGFDFVLLLKNFSGTVNCNIDGHVRLLFAKS